jgi:hypothetical protein
LHARKHHVATQAIGHECRHLPHAVDPVGGKAVEVRARETDAFCAECDGLKNVGAAPNPAVEDDLGIVADALGNRRESADGRK